MSGKPTGNTRYRTNWRGKIILQVEVTLDEMDSFGDYREYTIWRDARISDLSIEFKVVS